MLISSESLGALVQCSSPRATPVTAGYARLIVNTIERAGVVADSRSESSTRLQRILESHEPILTDCARTKLSDLLLFGIELPFCDAFPRRHEGRPCIFVFDGLLYLLRYYADLQTLIALLVAAEAAPLEVDGEPMPLALAASLAGHSAFVAAVESGHQLVDISSLLGPIAAQRSSYGYGAAALFFLLHELGHLACGHLDAGYVSERVSIETRIPEALSETQQMELEADDFALACIVSHLQAPIISSVMLAMGPFAFLETFSGAADADHPLTVNRLAHLADAIAFPEDPELGQAARSIVASEVGRFERLRKSRVEGGGDIRSKIHESMPLNVAYEIMQQVGQRIKAQFGTLDFAEADDDPAG